MTLAKERTQAQREKDRQSLRRVWNDITFQYCRQGAPANFASGVRLRSTENKRITNKIFEIADSSLAKQSQYADHLTSLVQLH